MTYEQHLLNTSLRSMCATVTLPSPGEVLFGLFMEPNGVEEKKPIILNRLNLSLTERLSS